MKRILLSSSLLSFFLCFSLQAQLQSYELLASYTVEEMQTIANDFGVPAGILNLEYEVDMYKVIYLTPTANGDMHTCSGAVMVPVGKDCASPLVSYQHGTVSHRGNVPSNFSGETNIGLLFASEGNVMSMSDYLGLGDSDLPLHPYVHAKSQATSSINMLRTTRLLSEEIGFPITDQLFLFGYSQGGHATMATHKEIQEFYSDEFTVTASAPMAGPYDVGGAQTDLLLSDDIYPTPGYLPYIMFAYQSVYGDLYENESDIFKAPYDEILLPLFLAGDTYIGEINGLCDPVPKTMMKDSVLNAFLTMPDHPFRIALEDNNVYEWIPESPVYIIHCEGDDQVAYENAVVAYDYYVENEVENVTFSNFGNFDHAGCVQFALLAGKAFFADYIDHGDGMQVDFDVTLPSSVGASDGSVMVSVTGGSGEYSYLWEDGTTDSFIDGLSYDDDIEITVTDALGCYIEEEITIDQNTGIENITTTRLQAYPSPMTSWAVVHLPVNFSPEHTNVQAFSISGQNIELSHTLGGHLLNIERGSLETGIYILQLTDTKNAQQGIVKLVVE